ncbi:uncharacterized protein [Aegilops tauschii subsp. strangulata]|uniref:uncharacterized protein isoform X4 n=1 Tax=Aegilops tauschii subsp. strangulata TaxID=200361 RepID=UPI003CC8DA4C
MRGGLGEGGSERTGQGRRPASACAGEVAHPAAKGTAGTGRGGPRQTSGRQQGAPHGEERTRSTPSFPTRYEKEEIGPRKLVVHIFMCHAEKNPNGELGCFCPLTCSLVFVYCSAGSSSPRLEELFHCWKLSSAYMHEHSYIRDERQGTSSCD